MSHSLMEAAVTTAVLQHFYTTNSTCTRDLYETVLKRKEIFFFAQHLVLRKMLPQYVVSFSLGKYFCDSLFMAAQRATLPNYPRMCVVDIKRNRNHSPAHPKRAAAMASRQIAT